MLCVIHVHLYVYLHLGYSNQFLITLYGAHLSFMVLQTKDPLVYSLMRLSICIHVIMKIATSIG